MNGYVDLETCIDLCLYIFPLFIFVFAKKSSPNVNLQMKRDIELQKPVAHTSIWLGKRESDQNKMYDAQKAKGLFIKLKYHKFQASISKWDVLIQNDQMLWIVKKPNEKLQRYVIIFLWEVIYVHFYNWDRPLDLVLVVYDLIELIIEASL